MLTFAEKMRIAKKARLINRLTCDLPSHEKVAADDPRNYLGCTLCRRSHSTHELAAEFCVKCGKCNYQNQKEGDLVVCACGNTTWWGEDDG